MCMYSWLCACESCAFIRVCVHTNHAHVFVFVCMRIMCMYSCLCACESCACIRVCVHANHVHVFVVVCM